MRIISPFHDYYDSVQKHGQDKLIIYSRRKSCIEIETKKRLPISYRNPYAHFRVIGFCGKLYPCAEFNSNTFYSLPEIKQYVLENLHKEREKEYFLSNGAKGKCSFLRVPTVQDFERLFTIDLSILNKVFQTHKVPVFVLDINQERITKHRTFIYTLELNCQLKTFDFFKVFSTYAAFQEISMYLSGVLRCSNKEIPEITNEDMINAKGFDKFSFRKDKSNNASKR